MAAEPKIARRLIVHGRVQGVFYRDWTVKTARALGLAGWVRNCPDGTVEIVAEGDAQTIDRLIELARKGPPAAEIAAIDVSDLPTTTLSGFAQR